MEKSILLFRDESTCDLVPWVQGFWILLGALFRKVRKSKVYVCASEGTGLPMRYYKRGWVCITQSQTEPQANLSSMLACLTCLDVKRGFLSLCVNVFMIRLKCFSVQCKR